MNDQGKVSHRGSRKYDPPLDRLFSFKRLSPKYLEALKGKTPGSLLHYRNGLKWVTFARSISARWQIELFFKWVKQHLKIKSFLGTTANAVMTQLWVALCVYLLVAYVKFLRRPPGRL